MLELYKGQIDLDKIKHEMSYKEALLMREVRVDRLKSEREELEKERATEASKQAREQARSQIMRP